MVEGVWEVADVGLTGMGDSLEDIDWWIGLKKCFSLWSGKVVPLGVNGN